MAVNQNLTTTVNYTAVKIVTQTYRTAYWITIRPPQFKQMPTIFMRSVLKTESGHFLTTQYISL